VGSWLSGGRDRIKRGKKEQRNSWRINEAVEHGGGGPDNKAWNRGGASFAPLTPHAGKEGLSQMYV